MLSDRRRIWFWLYRAGFEIVVWTVLVPFELIQMALGSSSIDDLRERLGRGPAPPKPQGAVRVLVHGVSVGETVAAIALVETTQKEIEHSSLILTSGTREGRRTARQYQSTHPGVELCSYLPWDRAAAIRKWLRRLSPDAVITVESEIWPNLYRCCKDLDVPVFIVNGRLQPEDVRRYRLARPFFQDVLGSVRWIGVQNERERDGFVQIGAAIDRIEVAGNLKFDVPLKTEGLPEWCRALGDDGPLIVAGSTHAPEERRLLDAFATLRADFPRLRLILAPRHPRRARGVRRLATRVGAHASFWSELDGSQSGWDVLIVDRIGVLGRLYRFADAAFVGGTLSRHGGHNLLEPAAQGCVAVVGPNVGAIRDLVEELDEAGALLRMDGSASGILEGFRWLLVNKETSIEMGRRGSMFFESRRGVASAYVRAIASRMRLTA